MLSLQAVRSISFVHTISTPLRISSERLSIFLILIDRPWVISIKTVKKLPTNGWFPRVFMTKEDNGHLLLSDFYFTFKCIHLLLFFPFNELFRIQINFFILVILYFFFDYLLQTFLGFGFPFDQIFLFRVLSIFSFEFNLIFMLFGPRV